MKSSYLPFNLQFMCNRQFHYNLGTFLHSIIKGKGINISILIIASQLYLGKDCIPKDDELCIPIVNLIMDAGKKSFESCHHETAYTYLEAATSLLPIYCWERYHDISLRLYFLTANAANGCCKYDKAETILKKILSEGCCVEDKLPSYYLLSQSKLQKILTWYWLSEDFDFVLLSHHHN